MEVFKCDRCKKVGGKRNTIALYSWRFQKTEKLFGRRFGLCDDCFKELVSFLKNE